MRAGLLNKIITIYNLVITKNEYGAETTTYQEKLKCRCRISDFGGGRTTQNSEIFYPYTKQFVVRRYQEIDDFDVIEYEKAGPEAGRKRHGPGLY